MDVISIAKKKVRPLWEDLEITGRYNQAKVLAAFQEARVGSHYFVESTGYGYSDLGRDALELVYQTVFQAEAALVRPQIVSGTHAINLCLSLLQSGDQLISISGEPYDTLQQIIGTRGSAKNSLINRGIDYSEVPLTESGDLDYDQIAKSVLPTTKMVMLQRSRGYSWRPAITIDKIEKAFKLVKEINPNCICFVDNCYGEFVETMEPTEVGANIIAGSLIKNPGGGLAPSGGYVVGDAELVEECSEYLTAPGLGSMLGPMFNLARPLLHGFFLAPHIVGQALRGAILTAQVFRDLGYEVSPTPEATRTDIIQAIKIGDRDKLLAFCHGVQKAAPVDAQFMPVPDEMPGYDDQIVMAGGTFIQGSSIELSADAPLREPYIVYFQGGMALEHIEITLESILKEI